MICPKCQFQNRPDSAFCSGCGKRLNIFCPACGAAIAQETEYCSNCGHDFHVYAPSLFSKRERESQERIVRERSARIAGMLGTSPGLKYEIVRSRWERFRPDAMRLMSLEVSLWLVLRDSWLSQQDDNTVSGFLLDYWGAIQELWPEAFENPSEYYIQGPTGVTSLSDVFPDVIRLCRETHDVSKEAMKRVLAHTGIGCDFWHVRHGKAQALYHAPRCMSNVIDYIRDRLPLAGLKDVANDLERGGQ